METSSLNPKKERLHLPVSTLTKEAFPSLPEEIIEEILVRLPSKPLFVFKTVCKLWLSLISQPSFLNSHLHHSRLSGTTIILPTFPKQRLKQPRENILSINFQHEKRVEKLRLNLPFPDLVVSVKASCDGLLLLSDQQKMLYVHNPATSMFKRLPNLRNHAPSYVFFSSQNWTLFYDTRVGKYKVCGFLLILGVLCIGVLLTLGEDTWREFTWKGNDILPDPENPIPNPYLRSVFLDNKFYWLKNLDQHSCVLCMDISSEIKFSTIAIPAEQHKQHNLLSAVKGSLCLVSLSSEHLDMFILEDSIHGIWTKRYSTRHGVLSIWPTFLKDFKEDDVCVVLTGDLDDDDISSFVKIFIHDEDRLICYDLEHQKSNKVGKLSKKRRLPKSYLCYSGTFVQV